MDSVNWLFLAADEMGQMPPLDFVHKQGWPAEAFGLARDVKEYNPGPIPATFFYDSSGRLVRKVIGAMNQSELREQVRELR